MLVGTRNGVPPDEAAFVSPWRDEGLRASLDSIGLGLPEQMGTTFLADAEQLRDFLGDARPLEDDFPLRLTRQLPRGGPQRAYLAMMDPLGAQRRFADSAWIRRMWPPALREATLARFPREFPLLNHCAQPLRSAAWLPELAAMAGDPASRAGMLWMMRSSHAVQDAAHKAAARGVQDALLEQELGVGLFVDGRFLEAEERFRRAQRHLLTEWLVQWRVLALVLGGERERAARLMVEAGDWVQPQEGEGWVFLSRGYGLPDPWGLTQARPAAPTP